MSRTRKISAKTFPPAAVATFRKELVAYYERSVSDFQRAMREGAAAHLLAGLPYDAVELMYREVEQTKAAELFWVGSEIAAQAFDASQDVPHISPADAPAPAGIIFFENPLPPMPMDRVSRAAFLEHLEVTANSLGGTAALRNLTSEVHGLMWAPLGRGKLAVQAFGLHGAKAPVAGAVDPRLPLAYFDAPLGELTEIEALTHSEGQQAFLSFVSALWVLMKTPTVAQVSEGDIATGTTRPRPASAPDEPAAPFVVPDKRRVQVVDMVPMRLEPETGEELQEGEGRRYRKSTYKWVVRGHWRNQRVGVGRAERRLTWIASYLKGNPDGPLKTSEKVYTWRVRGRK